MTRSTTAAFAVATAIAAALVGAAPAVAQNKPFYGVAQQGDLHFLQQRDFDRMGEGRVGTLRFLVNWPALERGDGNFDWQHIDRGVGLAAANGVRSLPFIYQTTSPRTNRARSALARFARRMAQRYGPGGEFWRQGYQQYSGGQPARPILAWQILNEQNSRVHWGSTPQPRAYARALRAAARAIRRVHPRAEILLGGMFGTPRGRGSLTSWQYLNRLYRVRGVKRFFNTVAIHPYAPNLKGMARQIRRIRGVMRRNGHRAGRIRLTEMGWGSASGGHEMNKGLQGQARMLTRSFRMLSKNRKRWKISGVNWFAWNDIQATPGGGRRICGFCPSAGLFTFERTPKPSWAAFVRATR